MVVFLFEIISIKSYFLWCLSYFLCCRLYSSCGWWLHNKILLSPLFQGCGGRSENSTSRVRDNKGFSLEAWIFIISTSTSIFRSMILLVLKVHVLYVYNSLMSWMRNELDRDRFKNPIKRRTLELQKGIHPLTALHSSFRSIIIRDIDSHSTIPSQTPLLEQHYHFQTNS